MRNVEICLQISVASYFVVPIVVVEELKIRDTSIDFIAYSGLTDASATEICTFFSKSPSLFYNICDLKHIIYIVTLAAVTTDFRAVMTI